MVLTCFQCQGPSLHLQCQQVCSWTPTRFVSVNGACSWTSLHLTFMNVTMGFKNRYYLLVTDVLYKSSTHERIHGVHSSSPHYHPWKSFWNSCLWDTAVGLKTGTIWTRSGLHPQGESAWEAPSRVPGRCWYRASSAPECQGVSIPAVGVYLWAGGIREMQLQIQLFFSSWNLSSLSLTILSEVSLHSDFKFRQIHHWLLKGSVHCKTRLSCSDTPSHLLQHAQPCF